MLNASSPCKFLARPPLRGLPQFLCQLLLGGILGRGLRLAVGPEGAGAIIVWEGQGIIRGGHQSGATPFLLRLPLHTASFGLGKHGLQHCRLGVARQLGLDLTRVDAEAQDAVLVVQDIVEADAEEHGGGFGRAVGDGGEVGRVVIDFQVVRLHHGDVGVFVRLGHGRRRLFVQRVRETHAADEDAHAGKVDDSHGALFPGGFGGGDKLGQDQVGEEKVADVVGGHGQFDAVLGNGASLDVHYSGIVDQDVNGGHVVPREDFFGSVTDGLLG